MDNPLLWAGIWLGVSALFAGGEIIAPGSFFLLPFAGGALGASIVSLIGAPVPLSWLVFIVLSLGLFFMLRPLANKLDADLPDTPGIGANRLVGHHGIVHVTIPAGSHTTGTVTLGSENWNAEGRDGMGLSEGTAVQVVEVKGTRVVVEPSESAGLGPIA